MQANFVDAYLFGPDADLDIAAAAMLRSLRRKCSIQDGDAISDVYRYEGKQSWSLPPHRCVSLVFGSNLSGAEGLGKSLQRLGQRLTRGTGLAAVFVSAEWDESPPVRVDAVGTDGVFTREIDGAVLTQHLRASTPHKKATLDRFMESDMMGPGALDLMASDPGFRAVFGHALAAESAHDLAAHAPVAPPSRRARARM